MTSGFTFGASASQKSPFGTPSTGLTFGAPAQAPQSTGLSFGTPASTSLTFGASANQTPGLSFGTPAAAQPGLTFGGNQLHSSTGQTSLTFGPPSASTPQAGLSFGTPTTSAPSGLPTFGATPSFGQTGLNFGTPTPTTTQCGLTFSTPVATVTPIGTFGTPTATTAQSSLGGFGSTGLTFGTPTTSSVVPTLGGFGVPTTTTAGFSLGTFGAGTSTPGSTFGVPITSAATSGFQGLTTTATSKPLGLFGATPLTTAPSIGYSPLNNPIASPGPPSFNLGSSGTGGLFGPNKSFPLTSGTGLLGSIPATTTATTTTSLGLGGIDPSQSKTGAPGSSSGRTESKAVKENQVPNEIVQTVESFKNFVKTQKKLSSDIAHGSSKPLIKVQEDTELLRQMLTTISSGVQRNVALAVKLKADTAMCHQNAEMAQRIQDTPPGMQYDNSPLPYFQDLVISFEREMQVFQQEIENTEKHMASLRTPAPLTSQELALAMRRLHDSFVALAGRLQSVHNCVESQKEQYLNLRKYFLKDSTNVFEEEAKKAAQGNLKPKANVKVAAGPTPFSALDGQHGFGLLPSSSLSKSASTGNPLGK